MKAATSERGSARALLAVGVVVVVAAVVVGLPLFGLRPYALVPLLLGSLTMVAGAALQKGEASASSVARSWKWLVPVVVTAAFWMTAHFVPFRTDVTRERVNSLAEESLAVADALDVDVDVVSFADGRAADELRLLVDRYRARNARVRFQQRSLQVPNDLDVARALGIADLLPLGGPNVVVVAAGQLATSIAPLAPVRLRFDAGLPNPEEQLTNALRQATSQAQKPVRAYVVAGHGEADVRDEGAGGLVRFHRDLRARNIELVPLSVAMVGRVPDDARLVIVTPSTTGSFVDGELEALRAWVDGGGALLLLTEPDASAAAPSMQAVQQALAGRFGVTVLADAVVDESPFGALLGGADTVTGSSQMAHAITRPLQQALTHFPRAAVLATAPIAGLEIVPVISTGSDAHALHTAVQGPLPLVIAADGHGEKGQGAAGGMGRAVVVADAGFVQNAGIGLGANRDLALNAVLWLVADESFIAVRPRVKTGALIFLTPSSRERLAFVLLFLIPVTLAALGAARNATRR